MMKYIVSKMIQMIARLAIMAGTAFVIGMWITGNLYQWGITW